MAVDKDKRKCQYNMAVGKDKRKFQNDMAKDKEIFMYFLKRYQGGHNLPLEYKSNFVIAEWIKNWVSMSHLSEGFLTFLALEKSYILERAIWKKILRACKYLLHRQTHIPVWVYLHTLDYWIAVGLSLFIISSFSQEISDLLMALQSI